ncbi:MAG: hypothetical protein C0467_00655 [Planctomycetaceae bacterium]|nr:hypothetical protein [Planctomycetaceae bacterium]
METRGFGNARLASYVSQVGITPPPPSGKILDCVVGGGLDYTNTPNPNRQAVPAPTPGAHPATGEDRMIRLPLSAALAAGLLWGSTSPATAQATKDAPKATPAAKDNPAPTGIGSPQVQKINELIAKGWADAGVKKPADKATDLEFMRRSFIDLIGRIPTPEEIYDFEMDRNTNKRAKLIYRLLNETAYAPKDRTGKPVTAISGLKMPKGGLDYRDAYAANFAELWTNWMLSRSNTHPQYRDQFRVWLTDQFGGNKEFPDGTPWNVLVQKVIGASGRTATNNAVVFVLRHLGDPLVDPDARKKGERDEPAKDGMFDAVPITSRVTRLFLGVKTQCVQCHNHPFNKEYVQADFWGINGFFRQTNRSGNTNVQVMRNNQTGEITPVAQLELTDMPAWNMAGINDSGLGRGMVRYERRDGQKSATAPAMLRDLSQFANGDKFSTKQLPAGEIPSKFTGKTRRQVLGMWISEHDNFAKAFVNRMWGHLFGRGLNKEPSVDDFSSNNELVHPELLDYLAAEFIKYNYDPKKLLEWICSSDVYSLSHVASKGTADQKFDPYFARMPLKAMSPEVLFDALAVATRAETRKDEKEYIRLKAAWTQKLTANFGDDEGNEVSFNGTVVQALLMMNGREINTEVGAGKKGSGGVIEDVMKKKGSNAGAIYDELFLMTISRHPSKEEVAKLEEVRMGKASLNTGGAAPPTKGPLPKGPAKGPNTLVPGASGNDDVTFYQDVFWALLNSSEFMLNH